MDVPPIGQTARKQHSEIIKENLGRSKARVEVVIRSSQMNGRRFKVARRYGEDSVVVDEGGNPSSFTPKELLPGVELYGQNEIYEIAQDSRARVYCSDVSWRIAKRMMNPNQLSRIVLRGLKSIRECDIELKELNVLIGPNGAGKSNFIGLFGLIQQILEHLDEVTA